MKKVKGIKGPHYESISAQRLREIVGIDSEGPGLVKQVDIERKAKEMGLKITHQTISNAVYGNVRTSSSTIGDIAKVLQALGHDISAAYLRGDQPTMTSDFTVNQIAEYTGLSAKSISILHEEQIEITETASEESASDGEIDVWAFSVPEMLNSFITSKEIENVLNSLAGAAMAVWDDQACGDHKKDLPEDIRYKAMLSGQMIIPSAVAATLYEQRAIMAFREWFHRLVNYKVEKAFLDRL